MYRQFGLYPDKAHDKRTVLDFRRNVLRELKKIKLARAVRRIAEASAAARRSGQGLEAAVRADRSAGGGFEAASQTLGSGLQRDRRSVARGVNVIWKRQQQQRERQRGPERDYGPSR